MSPKRRRRSGKTESRDSDEATVDSVDTRGQSVDKDAEEKPAPVGESASRPSGSRTPDAATLSLIDLTDDSGAAAFFIVLVKRLDKMHRCTESGEGEGS